MKKTGFFIAFLLASAVAFGQAANITSAQIDTSSTGGIQSKTGLLAAYNNLKACLNLPTKVLSPYYYYSFGDSFTSGTGASNANNRYASLNAGYTKLPFTNYGISGTGAFSAIGVSYIHDAPGTLVSCMIGLNDVKAGATTTSALTLAKIQNGVFAIIANHFVDSTFAAGSGTRISTTGTWSAYSAIALNGLYSNGLSTVTSGSTITFTSYGPTFLLALVGTDGTRYTYGSASITIDGTSFGTINENGQTDGIYDGLGNDNGRMPFSVLYSGLSEGKHTIVLTSIGTNPFCIDFFGQLKKPAQCFPIVIYDIAYLNATGQSTYPSVTNANVNAANAVIASDISNFTALGYPVFHALTNTYYNPTTDAYSDNLHPSDIGHRHLYQAFYSAVSSLQNPFVLQDLRSSATPSFANVSLSGITQAGIVYDASGPVLSTNAADFNYGSNTAGYVGLGVSGVNADSKLRILGPSGAGARFDYNGAGSNYYDANAHNIRTIAGGTIVQLTSSAATFYESIVPINTNTYNLGSSSLTFANGYFTTVKASSFTANAGTTTVAPIVLTPGTDLTTAAAGSFEYNGTRLAFSPSTTRKRVPLYTDATPTTNYILVGNGTDFTLTAPTGTGAPVEAASPTLSGTPLSTTASQNTNTTQIATTAYVAANVLTRRTLTAVNASATLTAAQMQSGVVTTSTVAVAFTTATAAQLYTQLGSPMQGSSFTFPIDNTASTSSGAITITLGTGLTSGLNPGLTVPIGKSLTYMITFTSSTTAVMGQIN